MMSIKLCDVPNGTFIRRKPNAKTTYTRGTYDRTYRRYRCDHWDDISRSILLSGDTIVWIDFHF
jgi:hypothetical protein